MGQITDLIQAAHANAISKGWWDEPRTFGEIIALIQSEVAEALEDFRNKKQPTEMWYEYKLPDETVIKRNYQLAPEWKPCGIPSELADIIIRIYDACGRYGWADEFEEKVEYHLSQPPHWQRDVFAELPFAENLTSINGLLIDSYRDLLEQVSYLARAHVNTKRLAGFFIIDLDRAISEKMAYNATRPQRHGGKVL